MVKSKIQNSLLENVKIDPTPRFHHSSQIPERFSNETRRPTFVLRFKIVVKARVFSIVMVMVLMIPSVTTYLFYAQKKREIRREVKHRILAGMDDNELTLLKFTKNEAENLYWEHSREFEFQDQMYDVVRMEESGDTIFYYCWEDHAETRANHKLKTAVLLLLQSGEDGDDQNELLKSYNDHLFHSALFQFSSPSLIQFANQWAVIDYPITEGYLTDCYSPPQYC